MADNNDFEHKFIEAEKRALRAEIRPLLQQLNPLIQEARVKGYQDVLREFGLAPSNEQIQTQEE